MFFMHFFAVLAVPSDDGQQWPEHVNAILYIFNLLHLMDLATHSSIEKCDGSGRLLLT
jgi:hypothetical protein